MLVTIRSEVARGVVARSVSALSKGENRLLGYVENMSGYYCRDCGAIKPLFEHTRARAFESRASEPFPSIQSSHGHCDHGIPFADLTVHPSAWPRRGPLDCRRRARLANIPEFVRPMARMGIEKFARERGALEVDEEVLDAAREFFGM